MKWAVSISLALSTLASCRSSNVPSAPAHAAATIGASGLDEVRIEARGME